MPAFTALIRGLTILAGTTRRSRMPMRVKMPTWTLAASALIHRPMGTKRKRITRARMTTAIMMIGPVKNVGIVLNSLIIPYYSLFIPTHSSAAATTIRLPSTASTRRDAPSGMNSPRVTTSRRLPPISAMPAGRSTVAARPV